MTLSVYCAANGNHHGSCNGTAVLRSTIRGGKWDGAIDLTSKYGIVDCSCEHHTQEVGA